MKRQVPTGINLLGFVVSSICDIATWKTKKKINQLGYGNQANKNRQTDNSPKKHKNQVCKIRSDSFYRSCRPKQVCCLYATCAGWLTEFELIIRNYAFERKLKKKIKQKNRLQFFLFKVNVLACIKSVIKKVKKSFSSC